MMWRNWAIAPKYVKDAQPSPPILGEHIGKTATLSATEWIVVMFDNDRKPIEWIIIQNPNHKPNR